MKKTDKISGNQGSIKPEETLTDIVRQVAYNRDDGQARMRAAANGALIAWLSEMAQSDIEADQQILDFALQQHGFDSLNEFVDAFFKSGEPVMAARKDISDIEPEDLNLEGSSTFDLQDPEGENDG